MGNYLSCLLLSGSAAGSDAHWRGGERPDASFKILMACCQVNMLQHGKGFLHPKDSSVIAGCPACLVLFYLFEGYLEGFPATGLELCWSPLTRPLESVVATSVWSHIWDILCCAG